MESFRNFADFPSEVNRRNKYRSGCTSDCVEPAGPRVLPSLRSRRRCTSKGHIGCCDVQHVPWHGSSSPERNLWARGVGMVLVSFGRKRRYTGRYAQTWPASRSGVIGRNKFRWGPCSLQVWPDFDTVHVREQMRSLCCEIVSLHIVPVSKRINTASTSWRPGVASAVLMRAGGVVGCWYRVRGVGIGSFDFFFFAHDVS